MAAIPALSSRIFTLDYVNDLEGQLINSPYAAQKLEEQGIDIEGLANYLGQYKEALSDEEPMMDLKALWKDVYKRQPVNRNVTEYTRKRQSFVS